MHLTRTSAVALFAAIGLCLGGLSTQLVLKPAKLWVLEPATAVSVFRVVQAKDGARPDGELLMVGVQEGIHSRLGAWWAQHVHHRQVMPLVLKHPKQGVATYDTYVDVYMSAEMKRSASIAAAVVAQRAGRPITSRDAGAVVTGFRRMDPGAQQSMRFGDVITAVDGRPVRSPDELHTVVAPLPVGKTVTLDVLRVGVHRTARLRTLPWRSAQGPESTIGVISLETDHAIDAPRDVNFVINHHMAGPSAGLAFALGVRELTVKPSLLRGRTIAATGDIQLDGSVQSISSVDLKLESALAAHAQVFLVPQANAAAARAALRSLCASPCHMQLVPVSTYDQAVSWLAQH